MSGGRRTPRDARRRRLGQNFLPRHLADHLIDEAGFRHGELVVDIGAGRGALTLALARRGIDVKAVELDPIWAEHLRRRVQQEAQARVRVVNTDFLSYRLPDRPFRVVGCLPFGLTTAILHRLLDRADTALERADLVVQWEVARKRAQRPPSNLLSTIWAPWWEFRLGRRIAATEFRPIPRVDGAVLVITKRQPPLLPPTMARSYGAFVQLHWPFGSRRDVNV